MYIFIFCIISNCQMSVLIHRVYLSISVESVVDFSSAIINLLLYRKGRLYVGLLREADSILSSGWHHQWQPIDCDC